MRNVINYKALPATLVVKQISIIAEEQLLSVTSKSPKKGVTAIDSNCQIRERYFGTVQNISITRST